jgi:S-DNA-T family DNA segregation ATPase FtsK/SpoIIIE
VIRCIPHPSWLRLIFIDGGRFALWDGPRALWRGAKRHPKLWAMFLALAGLTVLIGPEARWVVYAPVLLVPWAVLHWQSFNRWVVRPARSDWRRWRRYQSRWPDVASQRRLSSVIDYGLDVHPEIVKARTYDWSAVWLWSWRWPMVRRVVTCTDVLWLRDLIGNDLQDYQEQASGIARDYGARVGRAFDEEHKPRGCVRLELTYGPDPLAETIPALPIPESAEDIDFTAVPVGRMENGAPWTIDLGLHVLLAGATGSGKSGVLQQLIRSLAPAIRDGLVVVHAIDGKDGMELGPTSGMFRYYEDDDPEKMAVLLEEAVVMMKAQSRASKASGDRTFQPTLARPLHLIVIDEMIDLTDPKGPNREIVKRVLSALGLLLRKGRSAGFIVFGSVTDPRESGLSVKNGFPTRIGMRLKAPQETTTILGPGARLQGARCDEIGKHEPGVGYTEDAERVRAAYVTDADIAAMVAEYAPIRTMPSEPEFMPPEFDADATADEESLVLELVQGEWVDDAEGWE